MTETPESSERARWYMETFTPEQIAEMAAAQEAEVVALMAGGEPYDDEKVVPTPGQWITLFNRASAEQRRTMAQKAIADADHQYECFIQAWPERAREAEARLAACRCGPDVRVSVDTPPFDSDEVTLSVRMPGVGAVKLLACPDCRTQRHPGLSCDEAEAERRPWREWLADAYQKAVREHADGTGPNRLGVREPEQANATLRFENIIALNKALEETTAPRRRVPAKREETPQAGPMAELIAQYGNTDFELLRDREAVGIAASLTAAGFTVVRTLPMEDVAANPITIGRMHLALATVADDPWTPSPAGLTGWTVMRDDSLPDGEVHFRPRHKPADIEPYDTCHCADTNAGLELRARCPGRQRGEATQ